MILVKVKQNTKGAANKANILMAAHMHFASKGFTATSLADIEQAAKVSRGVSYHHFRSKDEMVQEITRENLGKMAQKIEDDLLKLRLGGSGSLHNILRRLVGFAEQITLGPGRAMSLHVWSLATLNPDVNATLVGFFEKIRLLLKQELQLLQTAGDYPIDADLDKLSSAFFAALIPGFIVQRLFLGNKSLKADDYVDSIIALFTQEKTTTA